MVTPTFNPSNSLWGWLSKHRHKAMFPLQPQAGDYGTGPDSDTNPTTGVTEAWAEAVVLVDPSTGLPYKATGGGGGGSGAPYVATDKGSPQLGLSITTSVSKTLTVPTGATWAQVQVEGGDARWRNDGPAPTSTVGTRMYDGQTQVFSLSAFTNLTFIAEAGSTGTVVLNVTYWA